MPKSSELLIALESFLGTARFTEFLCAGLVNAGFPEFRHAGLVPRLRYWQEVEWRKFIFVHPEFDIPVEELEAVLRFCEVHRQELHPETVEVFRGNLDWSPRYTQVRSELFPYAEQDPVSSEGNAQFPSHVTVWYCAACRVAREEWITRRASHPINRTSHGASLLVACRVQR